MKICRCEAVEPTDETDFCKVAEEIIHFALKDDAEIVPGQNSSKEAEKNISDFIETLYVKYKQKETLEENNSDIEIKKCIERMKRQSDGKEEKKKVQTDDGFAELEQQKLEEMAQLFYDQQNNLEKKVCYDNNKVYHPVKKTDKNSESDRGPGRKL